MEGAGGALVLRLTSSFASFTVCWEESWGKGAATRHVAKQNELGAQWIHLKTDIIGVLFRPPLISRHEKIEVVVL